MFNKILIIGCGLIGSSVLRCLKKNKSVKKIVSFDKNKSVNDLIKKNNLSDQVAANLRDAVTNSDLVLIATPLSSFESVIDSIKDNLKQGSILTDTCSVKKGINKIISNKKIKRSTWIPGHPVAGTENSGPDAGFADLFKDRWTIICEGKDSQKDKVEKLKKFWEFLGSKVKLMSFEDHDHILALTSHLPHAVAYNIVMTAIDTDDKSKSDIIKYSAGGLRDFTRIASSDPIMWRDIFIDNSENVIKILDKFSRNIEDFKKAVSEKNGDKLLKVFATTKNVRKEIIKAGQDVKSPDFGRKKS